MAHIILNFKILFVFFFIFDSSSHALEKIQGYAKVIDGDTIHIGKNKIRLYGIDAPEIKQKCFILNDEWDCGKQAKKNLINFINLRKVNCIILDKDRYKRDIAECYVGEKNINKWMVKNGWALSYRYYSNKYVDAEEFANNNNNGIWVGNFENPWDYRRKN